MELLEVIRAGQTAGHKDIKTSLKAHAKKIKADIKANKKAQAKASKGEALKAKANDYKPAHDEVAIATHTMLTVACIEKAIAALDRGEIVSDCARIALAEQAMDWTNGRKRGNQAFRSTLRKLAEVYAYAVGFTPSTPLTPRQIDYAGDLMDFGMYDVLFYGGGENAIKTADGSVVMTFTHGKRALPEDFAEEKFDSAEERKIEEGGN